MMKKYIIILVTVVLSFSESKGQDSFVGEWQVYDTLAFTQTKLGEMVLNKVKLIHKKLQLNDDGTFYIKHIEPKGFFIDADVNGTWQTIENKLVLNYQNQFENEQGKRQIEEVEDTLIIENDNQLRFEQEGKVFFYKREE